MRVLRSLPALLLAAVLPWSGLATAGDGEISDGRLDLLVYFTYPEEGPRGWEDVFTEYSKLLLNATEGGLQLGTVEFTTRAELRSQADVWVLDDTSGARAHLKGLGVPGRHITISQLHRSSTGTALGQFGLAHETGHYVWGVYDEYRGYIGNAPGVHFAHYCVSSFGNASCLMDGGTTVYPNYLRTEFCTDAVAGFARTQHFTGTTDPQGNAIRTDQEYLLGRSCWRQIEISGQGGLSHPLSDPSLDPPPHEDVVFDYTRYDDPLAMALVLDTSGSMSAEDKLAQAVLGAEVGVGLLRDQEYLTIVAFSDAPVVVYSARAMTEARKREAIAALEGLVADGGTVIGTAVLEAVQQLESVEGSKEFLVVVTDGISSDPDIDDPAVLDALVSGKYVVFAIALGAFPDDESLLAATAATGGQYFRAFTADDLPGIFATIFALAGAGTSVEEDYGGDLGPFGVQSLPFEVGEAAASARVTVSHRADADLGLALLTPGGATIEFANPPAGVETFGSAVQKTMRVPDPEVGLWQVVIDETQGDTVHYDLLAFVEDPALGISTAAAADEVEFPAPMHVEVSVVSGVPVGGVEVTGRVRRPDASFVPIAFHDDGLAVHGDEKRDDGIYSTLFTSYVGNGPYAFEIDVVNVDGGAASNLECGWYGRGQPATGPREEGQTWEPIAPFTATARRVLLLTEQAGGSGVGAASLEPHENLDPATDVDVLNSPPTPVAGFTLDVAPEEPLRLDSLVAALTVQGLDVSVLEGMALHLDADGDGSLDVPSIPLAEAELADGDRALVFARTGASLALLPAGEPASFLLTLGKANSGAAAGGTIGGPPAGRRPAPPWPRIAPAVLLPALLFLLLRRGRRRGPRRPRLVLRPGAALALAVASLGPACARSDGDRSSESFSLTVSPGGTELVGGVSEEPVVPSGAAQDFTFRAR